jgi:uncharacterized membrane protein
MDQKTENAIEKIVEQREKTHQLANKINRENTKEAWIIIVCILVVVVIGIFIFIENRTYGFYFVLGIALSSLLERISGKYIVKHNKRADEIERELQKEEDLCDKA